MNAYETGKRNTGWQSRAARAELLLAEGMQADEQAVKEFQAGQSAGLVEAEAAAKAQGEIDLTAIQAAGITVERRGAMTYIVGCTREQHAALKGSWKIEKQPDGSWAASTAFRNDGVAIRTAAKCLAATLTPAALAHKAEVAELRAAQRAEEKDELAAYTPHWPTYRHVLDLLARWRECDDAARHRDVGDYVALKGAREELGELAELAKLTDEHSIAKLLEAGRAPAPGCAKMIAVVLAKLAAKCGLTGGQPLSAATAHKQANLTVELPPADPALKAMVTEIQAGIAAMTPFDRAQAGEEKVAAAEAVVKDHQATLDGAGFEVEIPPAGRQRMNVSLTASKKTTEKPYLARLTLGLDGRWAREFAPRQKAGNTCRSFILKNQPCGAVIEARGYTWSREAEGYEGGTEYVVVIAGALLFISRSAADKIVRGATKINCDKFSRALKLSPDAPLPEKIQISKREDEIIKACLVNEAGEVLSFAQVEEKREG